jgi:hypothetical protein
MPGIDTARPRAHRQQQRVARDRPVPRPVASSHARCKARTRSPAAAPGRARTSGVPSTNASRHRQPHAPPCAPGCAPWRRCALAGPGRQRRRHRRSRSAAGAAGWSDAVERVSVTPAMPMRASACRSTPPRGPSRPPQARSLEHALAQAVAQHQQRVARPPPWRRPGRCPVPAPLHRCVHALHRAIARRVLRSSASHCRSACSTRQQAARKSSWSPLALSRIETCAATAIAFTWSCTAVQHRIGQRPHRRCAPAGSSPAAGGGRRRHARPRNARPPADSTKPASSSAVGHIVAERSTRRSERLPLRLPLGLGAGLHHQVVGLALPGLGARRHLAGGGHRVALPAVGQRRRAAPAPARGMSAACSSSRSNSCRRPMQPFAPPAGARFVSHQRRRLPRCVAHCTRPAPAHRPASRCRGLGARAPGRAGRPGGSMPAPCAAITLHTSRSPPEAQPRHDGPRSRRAASSSTCHRAGLVGRRRPAAACARGSSR